MGHGERRWIPICFGMKGEGGMTMVVGWTQKISTVAPAHAGAQCLSSRTQSASKKQHHAQSPRTGMHNRWLIFPALPETQSSSSGNQPRSETDGPNTAIQGSSSRRRRESPVLHTCPTILRCHQQAHRHDFYSSSLASIRPRCPAYRARQIDWAIWFQPDAFFHSHYADTRRYL